MSPSLFISDLHLHQTRSETSAAFFHFLSNDAAQAGALYILGDLFEYWVGDDQLDHDRFSRKVCDAIRILSDRGVNVFFMHGNRDFLIGDRFATEANLTILTDPAQIRQGDRSFLLLHGDTLCTDDRAYQQFRRQTRAPAWQAGILAKPYDERVALAASIRERSDTEKATKAADIMDVSPATVEAVFRQYGYVDMIHGHTHRPATHVHMVDGHPCTRQVLADWHKQAEFIRIDELGQRKAST
ncbi:MAG: UDP-2,3-diacylglucosamine diphosphatase [Rhodocyclaceae bacterium]|nr:UDP-2,3-diacylglucosamine diphosphatase [Rhodocyclaceae bacterium]